MPPKPFPATAFNPEAVFQPLHHVAPQMSRTPSHTSSAGRPVSGAEIQAPVMPLAANMIHEIRIQGAGALQDHILQNFDRPATSDLSILFVPSKGTNAQSREIFVHALVAQRSKSLWELVTGLKNPSRTVRIEAPNHFMTETGFLGALRYLYGAPLWYPETLFGELGQLIPEFLQGAPAAHLMPQVLSYIASGHYLGLPEVVNAGMACVRRLQTWDTIAHCLSFGLEGGIGSKWLSLASIKHDTKTMNRLVSGEPVFGEAATHVLHDAMVWLAMAFPPNFRFTPTATQLPELPRLPTVIENRPSQADPRLSLIQFGDMALEETGRPDYLTVLISSILMSLPFAALHFLFEQPLHHSKPLDWLGTAEAVVKEREKRRKAVLSAKRVKDAHNPVLWEATKWEEMVVKGTEPTQGYQTFQLRRERVVDASEMAAGA